MIIKTQKIKARHLIKHETKRGVFIKFFILSLILISYTGYLSYKYGFATGGFLAFITWSFFVLCTPVSDAGMILDFPIRLLFRLRMFVTEIFVWTVAILLNTYAVFFHPAIYEKSPLSRLFYIILTNPIPYWVIIALSFAGTFLSVHFADELMDYIKHNQMQKSSKYRLIFEAVIMISIFLFIFFVYQIAIDKFNIDISEF